MCKLAKHSLSIKDRFSKSEFPYDFKYENHFPSQTHFRVGASQRHTKTNHVEHIWRHMVKKSKHSLTQQEVSGLFPTRCPNKVQSYSTKPPQNVGLFGKNGQTLTSNLQDNAIRHVQLIDRNGLLFRPFRQHPWVLLEILHDSCRSDELSSPRSDVPSIKTRNPIANARLKIHLPWWSVRCCCSILSCLSASTHA